MKPIPISFKELCTPEYDFRNGIAILGCGGDLSVWFDNAAEFLTEPRPTESEDLLPRIINIPKDKVFSEAYYVTTTKGRVDLILFFSEASKQHTNYTELLHWMDNSVHIEAVQRYKAVYNHHHDDTLERQLLVYH